MKSKVMALAVALAGLIAATATANDERIAQQIIQRMQQHKQQAQLQDFNIGVQVDQGTVTVMGTVAQPDHAVLALDVARRVPGVKLVVNDLFVQPTEQQATATSKTKSQTVGAPSSALAGFSQPSQPSPTGQPRNPQSILRTASESHPPATRQPAAQPPTTAPHVAAASQRPAPASPNQTPVAFARSTSTQPVSYHAPEYRGQVSPAQYSGSPAPVPMSNVGGGSLATATYDNPQVPGYAWPSYASYPNYGAVTYPHQYSATAWPYIGPFYPYPQVPLGWRKVTLEWDDGWWFLDFKSK